LLEGEPAYRQRQVWHGLYTLGRAPSELTELPAGLRERLSAALPPALSARARSQSRDGTVKWLWALHDGAQVETVLMPYAARATVCASSQAGCAMGCQFCATGQAGFQRHLSTGEILEQVATARREAAPRRVTNVVFMGMGEPLANYDRVWAAVERLHAEMGLSARHITLSTVGLVPGIRRLSAERLPVNLAVSLHAANDELRNRLVPINRRWPLSVLLGACGDYARAKGRRLSFEWALIDGVNDSDRDVAELAGAALPLGAHVNLIPLNPTPGYPVRGSTRAVVQAFAAALVARGVNATVRRNRGTDIEAACGQLAGRDRADRAGADRAVAIGARMRD
jgi:23S rRNA (adenine2503-C2)-methyltransferase